VHSSRDRLEADRRRTYRRLVALSDDYAGVVAASRDTNADDEHDPEGMTIAFERSQVDALVRQAREHLAEIDAAIARLETGTYGLCEVCGEPLPQGRLEARPTARTCMPHAR
jgi:RNA polymerase-binding transcription factor DksA